MKRSISDKVLANQKPFAYGRGISVLESEKNPHSDIYLLTTTEHQIARNDCGDSKQDTIFPKYFQLG